MPRPEITPESQRLLDLILPPNKAETSEHTDGLYEMVGPFHELIDHMTIRINEIEKALHLADTTENGPHAHGFFNSIQALCDGAMGGVRELSRLIRSLTDTFYAIDQIGRNMDGSLESHEERHKFINMSLEDLTALEKDATAYRQLSTK